MTNSQIKCLQHPKTPSQSIYNLKAQGYSFPSGHTSSATAVYGSLANYLRNRYVTIVCVAIIAVVAFSRIFLGVHFPSDVLAGLIVGFVSVFLVSFLFNRFDSFWPYLILFIFMIPGMFLGGSGFHAKMSLFLHKALICTVDLKLKLICLYNGGVQERDIWKFLRVD